jgi:general nucleoside transport system ATP-binding protein
VNPATADAEVVTAPAVTTRALTRRFGSVVALDDVDITLRAGEIHALLGENGAGKTTLVRILAGLETPSEGEVDLWGRPVRHFAARAARRAGVALVQQHFTLVPTLTAEQNLVLARPSGRFVPRSTSAGDRLRTLVERYGLDVRGGVPVSRLSVGEQQRLEILRALDADASILLLDEPTAVLTATEAAALLDVCRRLADEGRSVVIITHRLAEVTAGCDRVTVLRDGAVVLADAVVAEQSKQSLADAMVGRTSGHGHLTRPAGGELGGERIVLEGVTLRQLSDVTFAVRGGEVLGVAGVDGNGQAELESVLAGVEAPAVGTVSIDGLAVDVRRPRRRIERGIAYIPSDRYRWGMIRPMTLADNVELGRGGRWRRGRRHRHEATAPRLAEWDVRSAGPSAALRSLSGGNAQKLLLSREMHPQPGAVIACHPTRGLDPVASHAIADRVLGAAADGAAVVWVGVELEELLAVSDRVVVLAAGRITGEFLPPFDRNAIGLAMGGGA